MLTWTSEIADVQFAQLEQIAKLITTPPRGISIEVRAYISFATRPD